MKEIIHWGIIGCGRIAHKFAHDLNMTTDSILESVASRDMHNARQFAEDHGANSYYDEYESLVKNPKIDVVYIATVHPYHHDVALLCMKHGKSVLCEKPLAMNGQEVQSMVNSARNNKVFLMEAMWTRFIPAIEKMLTLIDEGKIGTVKSIHADFGFLGDQERSNRLFNKALGGGALMDIGIYPLYLSLLILGYPESVVASAHLTETGVDVSCGMVLRHTNGAVSSLHCTFMAHTQIEAWIHGTNGSIKLHRRFHHPGQLSIYHLGELSETFDLPYTGIGYYHEIEHVNDCLKSGLNESPKMSLSHSIHLMKMLDEVRAQVGVIY